jgi:glycerophosphoryl diester phosphodiesterase
MNMNNAHFDIQGHRGARGLMPENTVRAFIKALELGTPTLEMDVVISADDEVVVSHEPWISRMLCSLPGGGRIPLYEARRHLIYKLTYDEIARYDAGGMRHPRFPDQALESCSKPLLREVIRTCDARAGELGRPMPHYSIETKSRRKWEGRYHPDPENFVRLLANVLEEESIADRAIIQSFDIRTLQAAWKLERRIRLSLLVLRRHARRVNGNVDKLGFVPHIYSPDHRAVDRNLVATAHGTGMRVIPWTVNDMARMRELKEIGCDGLITDYPDRALESLG